MTRDNLHVHYSAQDYDRYTAAFVAAYDKLLLNHLAAAVARRRGEPGILLDVGTGTAQLLAQIAFRPAFEHLVLVGTDYFPDMIALARSAVAAAGVGHRVRLLVDDAHRLSASSESIDYVISRSTIHHWADPPRAFREIHRVLRPGGLAIFHEPRRDADPEALAAFNRKRQAAGIEPVRLDEKFTVGEIEAFLAEAGLAGRYRVVAPEKGPRALGLSLELFKHS